MPLEYKIPWDIKELHRNKDLLIAKKQIADAVIHTEDARIWWEHNSNIGKTTASDVELALGNRPIDERRGNIFIGVRTWQDEEDAERLANLIDETTDQEQQFRYLTLKQSRQILSELSPDPQLAVIKVIFAERRQGLVKLLENNRPDTRQTLKSLRRIGKTYSRLVSEVLSMKPHDSRVS